MDKLGDILLQLPSIFFLCNEMRHLRKSADEHSESYSRSVEDTALQLRSRLGDFGLEHQHAINSGYHYSRFLEVMDFQNEAKDWKIMDSSPSCFQDPFAALTIALYDAGTILANAIAWEATTRNAEQYKQRIAIHCESILSAVVYLESKGSSSGGTLLMIFPLKVACRTTPSTEQRRRARAALAHWGARRGVDGLCKFSVHESEGVFGRICEAEANSKVRNSPV